MMEIIGIGHMYRQHPHEGQHPTHQPNSYNQYQNLSAMNGRRSMSTHFEPTYPVYPNSHVGYNLQYSTGYDYVPQQPQGMVQSYHQSAPQHHAMQPPPPNMYAPQPPQPLNASMHAMRDHTSPQHSPTVKREQRASPQQSQPSVIRSMTETDQNGDEVGAKTDVDTLMRAIQSKTSDLDMASPITNHLSLHNQSPIQGAFGQDRDANGKPKKKYPCNFASCGKFFFQKTHLDIHMRAHTGDKPFECRQPGCGQRFSQLGNLKTHERRHTGERPYSCEACGKRFAQRGNVRAHRVVHENIKPFTCKLDNCGKNFTQLGNLKSHQNKFHSRTIQDLTAKFANTHSVETVGASDRELWDYFSTLYKNSNRGIKGRGKDRRIATAASPVSSRSDSGKGGNRIRKSKADPSAQLLGHHGLPPMRGYSNGSSSTGTSEHD